MIIRYELIGDVDRFDLTGYTMLDCQAILREIICCPSNGKSIAIISPDTMLGAVLCCDALDWGIYELVALNGIVIYSTIDDEIVGTNLEYA